MRRKMLRNSFHSTETSVFRVASDILEALDRGDLAALTLLDAFDTVDLAVLIHRLESSYGIRTTVLDWFKTYLGQRVQQVRFRGCRSAFTVLSFGVPQGSVLEPIIFLIYTADLIRLIEGSGMRPVPFGRSCVPLP